MSLQTVLRRPQPNWWTPTAQAIVLAGVLLALVHAHGRGVAHGSLRPDCILIDADHRPIVSGFGARDGPEAMRSMKAMMRADVFSFSLIMYAVLSSSCAEPTAQEAAQKLKQSIKSGDGKKESARLGQLASVPERLVKLIIRGITENPAERPSMEDILDEFESHGFAILAGVDTEAVRAFAVWADESERQEC
jgi:serine/threonine protein kinase